MNIKEVQTLIKVEHLVKRYGNRNVVDDLTFTVEKGQIVGFLGPNGAGKSTTMNHNLRTSLHQSQHYMTYSHL